jgi:predicted metal-dependent hydrolase
MPSLSDFFTIPFAPKALTPIMLPVSGRMVTITLKRNSRARRMTLRMDKLPDTAVMTIPRRAALSEAKSFAERSGPWIAKQLARQVEFNDIRHGVAISLRGRPHNIAASGKARGVVRYDAEMAVIELPGAPEHLPRRLTDWLKQQARQDLKRACDSYASAMAISYTSISVRDQKSRWGSCASNGALSFSWRLVMAPDFVLDYVAAHEVAHLRELNHGAKFWRLVLKHCPHTKKAKDWLKANGRLLHAIG